MKLGQVEAPLGGRGAGAMRCRVARLSTCCCSLRPPAVASPPPCLPAVKVQLAPYNRIRLMKIPILQVSEGGGGDACLNCGEATGWGVEER